MTYRVLIADKMDKVAAEIFTARGITVDVKTGLTPADLAAIIGDYDGVAVRSTTKIGADVLGNPGKLRVIGRAGIGVDTVDVPAATRAGIVVMNTPFGNSVTTAEHTIAMMMSLARQIPMANASTHAGKWEKSAFMGVELMGKILGVIGCGNIGANVAARALGLQMRVMAYDPYLTDERAVALGVQRATLDEIYAASDFITIHTPMTDQTRGLVNTAAFSKMKKGVRIINCARGGLVVEADLKAAMESGIVAGAALDVFETEPATTNILFGMPNVICTPHLGASTTEAQINVARQIAEQMSDFLLNGAVANAVNSPSVSAEDAPRLAPYVALVDAIGMMAAQIVDDPYTELNVEFAGAVSRLNTKPLVARVLAAALSRVSNTVNMVNAPDMARSNGIAVQSVLNDDQDRFDATVNLVIKTARGAHNIKATLFGGHPRIVDIDGVAIDAAITPHMIFIRNKDQPGMIGALGTVLADASVNIADFRLGRMQGQGSTAIALVSIDSALSDDVLLRVRAVPQIEVAKRLGF